MLLFYIKDVRGVMGALLKSSVFDSYEVRGVTLQSFTHFDISCEATEPPEKKYCTWSEIRPVVFDLTKGKKPPKHLKIRLCLTGEEAYKIDQNAAALHMTLTYENGRLGVLTGMSQRNFVLDNSVDHAWDNFVTSFFAENGFEILESAE